MAHRRIRISGVWRVSWRSHCIDWDWSLTSTLVIWRRLGLEELQGLIREFMLCSTHSHARYWLITPDKTRKIKLKPMHLPNTLKLRCLKSFGLRSMPIYLKTSKSSAYFTSPTTSMPRIIRVTESTHITCQLFTWPRSKNSTWRHPLSQLMKKRRKKWKKPNKRW